MVNSLFSWLGGGWSSGVGSISWLVRRGHRRDTTCEPYAKIIAESELLQPALNDIHKFCFQHWSRGRGTCGTGSDAPVKDEAPAFHNMQGPILGVLPGLCMWNMYSLDGPRTNNNAEGWHSEIHKLAVKHTQTSMRLLSSSKLSKLLQKWAKCSLQPEDYQSGGEENTEKEKNLMKWDICTFC